MKWLLKLWSAWRMIAELAHAEHNDNKPYLTNEQRPDRSEK